MSDSVDTVDTYVDEVIKRGDEGSALLAALCAPTLKNCQYVGVIREGMNGLAVLRLPDGYNAAVFSAHGDSHVLDPEEHAASMVWNLQRFAHDEDIEVLGFADMIDANKVEKDQGLVKRLGSALVAEANRHKYAIMNGELALLGNRVTCDANVSGTAVGMVRSGTNPGSYFIHGRRVFVFDPAGEAVYMNSDGEGTKAEFNERAKRLWLSLENSAIMKSDDVAKIWARIRAMFDFVESSGEIPKQAFDTYAKEISNSYGFPYFFEHENVGGRLQSWALGELAINVGGSAVSTIDGYRLANLPMPRAGDYLVAVRGKPNPRSNGITDKRRAMIKALGERWHETPEGRMFLDFLSEPCTCFYPVFLKLLEEGSATSVYHMSGGAFDGKLAKPLARHSLYAKVEGLFEPDWRELALAGFLLTPAEVAYAKWPMGNEGFVTTNDPEHAIRTLKNYELDGMVVSQLEYARNGRTGVELVGTRASNGSDVYFSGR